MYAPFIAVFAALAAIATANSGRNPVVLSIKNGTYSAGEEIIIKWANATTGFLNIDLVNEFSEVLKDPVTIALGVPASDNQYAWKVPDFLRTAVGYKIRVWGQAPPNPLEKSNLGSSASFTIFNNVPQAVNTFKVLTPNSKQVCAVGQPCQITWDYPQTINGPAYVHIQLFKAGNPNPVFKIDDVPAELKAYTWNVPNDPALINEGLYVSVSGAGTPPAGPGFSNEMGANGQPFAIAAELPPANNAQQGSQKGDFEEQAINETITETSTVITGTTTVFSTVSTDSGAVAVASRSSLAAVLIVPLLVLLF